jgi:hypothetical protein
MAKHISGYRIFTIKFLCIAFFTLIFNLVAQAAPIARFTAGTTTIVLSDDFLSGLTLLGVTVKPVVPATFDPATKTARFPVTGGIADLANAQGELVHQGGLRFFTANTHVHLLNFIIDTSGSSPVLTGEVVINSKYIGRTVLFNLTLPAGVTLPVDLATDGTLEIADVALTLSPGAASTLNTALNTNLIKDNFPVGTAKVSLKGRKLAVSGT